MAQKWSKSWILSTASLAACTFLALDSDVDDGRGAEVTCFKTDFGIPGNLDGGYVQLGEFSQFSKCDNDVITC